MEVEQVSEQTRATRLILSGRCPRPIPIRRLAPWTHARFLALLPRKPLMSTSFTPVAPQPHLRHEHRYRRPSQTSQLTDP
jgi:hypothetical protein